MAETQRMPQWAVLVAMGLLYFLAQFIFQEVWGGGKRSLESLHTLERRLDVLQAQAEQARQLAEKNERLLAETVVTQADRGRRMALLEANAMAFQKSLEENTGRLTAHLAKIEIQIDELRTVILRGAGRRDGPR